LRSLSHIFFPFFYFFYFFFFSSCSLSLALRFVGYRGRKTLSLFSRGPYKPRAPLVLVFLLHLAHPSAHPSHLTRRRHHPLPTTRHATPKKKIHTLSAAPSICRPRDQPNLSPELAPIFAPAQHLQPLSAFHRTPPTRPIPLLAVALAFHASAASTTSGNAATAG
jgi:hypothetical protein